jgi:eukaryotic-like serine/threonine-protein kinase
MAAQNNAPLPDGLDIAGYRIVKKIASGGFSIVYLAYDPEGNAVAIKEYLPSQLALRAPGSLCPTVPKPHLPIFRIGLKCFFEEGRALARIYHPNVVRVLNFFRANETVYMVMAYESGHTLQDHIARLHARDSRMGEASIRRLFNGVCAGVREVHANKLLHLDLKPANIYLRTDGSPLLLDFGAARQTINLDAPMLAPMYTPGFAAPELYSKSGALGPWTDIYSIGAAMYACMTRAMPPAMELRQQGDATVAQFARLAGRYSPELVDMVASSMALDPLARPQSVFAMQKVLQAPPSLAAPNDDDPAARATGWRALLERFGGKVRT